MDRLLSAMERRSLKRESAIDGETFDRALRAVTMVYQPIVCWSRRQVAGYEALLRSCEPSLLQAGPIISAAERLDRVQDLGRCVRSRVAARLTHAPIVDLFVNLHSLDLLDEDLFSDEAPLSRFARRVVLEITERTSLETVDDVKGRLARLRAMGYRIALDDLGAGYAALSSMVLLQPEVVKIDMSLVRDVDADPVRQKLIAMMVTLCRELGTLVVVEGVETVAERIALETLGCDLLQGFLFARPGAAFPTVCW